MRSQPRCSALVALQILVAPLVWGQAERPPAPEVDSITAADLRADLFFLASDGMQGRLSETPENHLAAEFVASRFTRAGLEPPGGSFFQQYRLAHSALGSGNGLEILGDVTQAVQLGEGFYPQRFSPAASAEGALAFAGFGIRAPDFGWDDWEGAGLDGRVALIFDHEPGEADPASLFDGLVTSEVSRPFRKAVAAAQAGAAGVLFVRDVHQHPGDFDFAAGAQGAWPDPPRRVPRITLADWVESVEIPAVVISPGWRKRCSPAAGTRWPRWERWPSAA